MKKALTIAVFFISLTIICAAGVAIGQDPVKVAPDNYKVVYEDDTVRILEFNDVPGTKIPKHSHPEYFVYVVSDATRLFTTGGEGTDCKGGLGVTKALKADEKIPSDGSLNHPVTHCEENTGKTNTRLIAVEFKPRIGTSTITTTTTTTTIQRPD